MESIFQAILFCLYIVLALIGAVLVVLKGYDYYSIKKDIWLRKGIGVFSSDEAWEILVKEKSFNWILKMPKVQVSDSMNFILMEKLTGRYSKNVLQGWQYGGLLLGLGQYMKKNPHDIKALSTADNVLKNLFDEGHNWKKQPMYIDYALLAYAIMKLPSYGPHHFKAMNEIAEVIKNHIGEEGTVFYRSHIRNYRLVDTIGMVCPFLIRFGTLYDNEVLIDLALTQIERFEQYGVHPLTNIPGHAYHIHSKMPLGIYGWGRGVGWYALGLIDSYEELPQSHPERDFLKEKIQLLAKAIVDYKRPKGGWGHSFFTDNNIYDSSVTAMNGYFLKKALSMDIIEGEDYIKAMENSVLNLRLSTRQDGSVDFSQGDTKDIGTYSKVFGMFPFTQGMTLRILYLER